MGYGYLSLEKVKGYEPLAKDRGVSTVARSPRGFLTQYKRVGGVASQLPELWKKRILFIKRHLAQLVKNEESLFRKDGTPTRRHLALIMWAYSPIASEL